MQESKRQLVFTLAGAAVASALPLRSALAANDGAEARGIVDRSRVSFSAVLRDKNLASLHAGVKQARGILIFPQVLRAGFFLGGSGGTGVLLVRHGAEWSDPAFYTMGSVSFGLQFGGQAAEVVILVNNQSSIDRLLTSSLRLGGDASVAAGPAGAGQAAAVNADFVSYARARGAFIGMSFEGSVLSVRESLNAAYFGQPATPVDILVKRSVANKHSAALRKTIATAAR